MAPEKKKTVLSSGELAFRAWAENLPVVGAQFRSVRYNLLSRMQEIVSGSRRGRDVQLTIARAG